MVTGGRQIIDIGYKYNKEKVIYFNVTENAWITNTGLPYLYKYPEQFPNLSICPVASTLVMYKFFGSVNEVEPHNK